MAANANTDLSSMLSEEDSPVAEVSRDPLGVKVQFGGDETIGAPGDDLPFAVEKINGKAPAIKKYGSLFGCVGGTLTIEDKRYRIHVFQQQENVLQLPVLNNVATTDWPTLPFTDIPSDPKEGEFLKVPLLEATELPDNGLLYCRGETCRLWKRLSHWSASQADERSVVGAIVGPPGTGKSTTTFAWLQAHVKATGRSATWIHVLSNLVVHRVDFLRQNGHLAYWRAKEDSFKFLESHIKGCSSEVLVLDGYRKSEEFKFIPGEVSIWAGEKKGKRTAVLVSYFAFKWRVEEVVGTKTRLEIFRNFSWTLAEYYTSFKRARPDQDFGKKVSKRRRVSMSIGVAGPPTMEALGENSEIKQNKQDKESIVLAATDEGTDLPDELLEEIDEKFYYAGHSARFFFGLEINEVKDQIVESIEELEVTNVNEVLETGSKHRETRHRLVAYFQAEDTTHRKCIVSKFAVEELVKRRGQSTFPFLYGVGSEIPTFDGWVFEADFFFQYKRAFETKKNFILIMADSSRLELIPSDILTFDHKDMCASADSGGQMLERQHRNGAPIMWKPKAWNQGGYDCFYVNADSVSNEQSSFIIRFFQVTRGTSHKLKLKYVVEVVQVFIAGGLKISKCEIYFVIPEDSKHETRVGDVNPHGTLFNTSFGWVNGREKDQIRVVKLNKTTSVEHC